MYAQPGYYQDWQGAGAAHGNGQIPMLTHPKPSGSTRSTCRPITRSRGGAERYVWLFAAGSFVVAAALLAVLVLATMGFATANVNARAAKAKALEDEARTAEGAASDAARAKAEEVRSIEADLAKARAADENLLDIQELETKAREAQTAATRAADRRTTEVKKLKDEATKAKAAVADSRRQLDLGVMLVCACLTLAVGGPMCRAWKRALTQSREDRTATVRAIRQLENDYALRSEGRCYSPLGEEPKPDQKAEEAAAAREQFFPKALGWIYLAVFVWVSWAVFWDWGVTLVNKVSSYNLPGPYG